MGKNKKLKKSIKSFEERIKRKQKTGNFLTNSSSGKSRIKEHENKIEEYEGEENSPIINYWEKEINNFKKKKEEQGRKLIKK